MIERATEVALVTLFDKEKKNREMIEEQNLMINHLAISVKDHGARSDALLTRFDALETKGCVSANMIVLKVDIAELMEIVA